MLGDVPVVGTLFRYDARRREKTNLMVFLKPTVLRTIAGRARDHVGALRLPQNEQQRHAPGDRYRSGTTRRSPSCRREGERCPGMPGAG